MEHVSTELLRALRGARSQVAFSRRLGYRSNVAADWESGRRSPNALELLRAAERVGVDVVGVLQRFHPPAAPEERPETAVELAAWLRELQGGASHQALAERLGLSRHRVGRWLRGDAVPRVPEFLALIEATTGRVVDLVGDLVSIDAVPSLQELAQAKDRAARVLFEVPWTPGVLAVVEAVPGIAVEALAGRLGLSTDEAHQAVSALLSAGVLEDHDGLVLGRSFTSAVRGAPEDRRALQAHWSNVAHERFVRGAPEHLFGFNVFAVSAADMEQIRGLYRSFYREVRAIVAQSSPTDTAGLLVVHLGELATPTEEREPGAGTHPSSRR